MKTHPSQWAQSTNHFLFILSVTFFSGCLQRSTFRKTLEPAANLEKTSATNLSILTEAIDKGRVIFFFQPQETSSKTQQNSQAQQPKLSLTGGTLVKSKAVTNPKLKRKNTLKSQKTTGQLPPSIPISKKQSNTPIYKEKSLTSELFSPQTLHDVFTINPFKGPNTFKRTFLADQAPNSSVTDLYQLPIHPGGLRKTFADGEPVVVFGPAGLTTRLNELERLSKPETEKAFYHLIQRIGRGEATVREDIFGEDAEAYILPMLKKDIQKNSGESFDEATQPPTLQNGLLNQEGPSCAPTSCAIAAKNLGGSILSDESWKSISIANWLVFARGDFDDLSGEGVILQNRGLVNEFNKLPEVEGKIKATSQGFEEGKETFEFLKSRFASRESGPSLVGFEVINKDSNISEGQHAIVVTDMQPIKGDPQGFTLFGIDPHGFKFEREVRTDTEGIPLPSSSPEDDYLFQFHISAILFDLDPKLAQPMLDTDLESLQKAIQKRSKDADQHPNAAEWEHIQAKNKGSEKVYANFLKDKRPLAENNFPALGEVVDFVPNPKDRAKLIKKGGLSSRINTVQIVRARVMGITQDGKVVISDSSNTPRIVEKHHLYPHTPVKQ